VPLYPNGTAFTLQPNTSYCTIGADFSFGCAALAGAATVFGQTADGNLTYQGSGAFYTSSVASAGANPTMYVVSLAVSMNIVWGGTGVVVSPTPTSSVISSGSSSAVLATSTSVATSSSSSSGVFNIPSFSKHFPGA